VLFDTKIAHRQELLVDPSDKIEGKSEDEQVALARNLIANPPK
jgi:hypothetical protein